MKKTNKLVYDNPFDNPFDISYATIYLVEQTTLHVQAIMDQLRLCICVS